MGQPSAGAAPADSYASFAFRLKWDGRYVAGVRRVGHLRRTTQVVSLREGGAASSTRKSPGRTEYDPIGIELGVTHDRDFEQWANDVRGFEPDAGAEPAAPPFRRDLTIEVYDEAGTLVLAYRVYRCWVSEYQALPDLDADANAVLIQHLTLENEGWERDPEVP